MENTSTVGDVDGAAADVAATEGCVTCDTDTSTSVPDMNHGSDATSPVEAAVSDVGSEAAVTMAVPTTMEVLVAAGPVSVMLVIVRLFCSHSVACVLQVSPVSQHRPSMSPVQLKRPLQEPWQIARELASKVHTCPMSQHPGWPSLHLVAPATHEPAIV